jgi:hypothetical protein
VLQWLVAAVVVEAIGLGLVVGTMWTRSNTGPTGDYRTVTIDSASSRQAAVRVVFAPDMTLQSLQSLLQTAHLDVVSGPSSAGVYTLALRHEDDSIPNVLALLRLQPQVRFAEPLMETEPHK